MNANQPPCPQRRRDPDEDAFTAAEMTSLLVGLFSAIRGIEPADLPEEVRARIAGAVAARDARD